MNIVILPILLYYFFEFPCFILFFLNLWVVPLSSALLALGMAGSLLAVWFPGAGVLILQLCGWILDLFEVSCRGMLELPGARQVTGRPLFWQIVLYFGILILIFCIWKTVRTCTGACLICGRCPVSLPAFERPGGYFL